MVNTFNIPLFEEDDEDIENRMVETIDFFNHRCALFKPPLVESKCEDENPDYPLRIVIDEDIEIGLCYVDCDGRNLDIADGVAFDFEGEPLKQQPEKIHVGYELHVDNSGGHTSRTFREILYSAYAVWSYFYVKEHVDAEKSYY
ncbi:MAG: hypothetical protein ACW99G_02550 [Candidatus Thorarchaeota archaeon]|jgi:hypothetical protein